MRKKDLFFFSIIFIFVILFLWQWLSKGSLIQQNTQLQKYQPQLQLLSGIGALGSAHWHADVKVYINGQSIDFSKRKYQLATSFIHFEEGVGDVIHMHATGLTVGHMFKSLGMNFNNNCLYFEGQTYCNSDDKKLRFYVNGESNDLFDNYAIKDLDKILVSYGDSSNEQIQEQLKAITNLAPNYSAKG